MRVFVAIEIDEKVRQNLACAQERLKACLVPQNSTPGPGREMAAVKWVEPKNFHMTLKFLGETETGVVSRLANELAGVAAGIPEFMLGFGGAGTFPDERRPRVVWIGIEEGLEQLFSLAQRVEEVCQTLGFEAENRPFSAHLTLGRARGSGPLPGLQAGLEALAGESLGRQRVDHVAVIQSTLTRSGPIYRTLHKLALRGEGDPSLAVEEKQ